MDIIIKDNQYIYFDNILPLEESAIFSHFSAEIPGRRYIDTEQMCFSGVFRKYNLAHHRMDRAFLIDVKELCDKKGFSYTVTDRREPSKYITVPSSEITETFVDGITLDAHQIAAIKAGVDNEIGIIELPTGAGKTEVAAGICLACNCPTVILAEQTIVVEQIKRRLELRNVTEEVGVFFAGKTPSGQVILVGTIQSLSIPSPPKAPKREPDETETHYEKRRKRYLKNAQAFKTRAVRAKNLRKLIKNCELLIVDEADRATNKMWAGLFRYYFKGRRRLGLSGTPFDPDRKVQNLHLKEHLGSIIAFEDRFNLEKLGRIEPVDIYFYAIGDKSEKNNRAAFDIAVNEEIIYNEAFHNIVKDLCARLPADDGKMILVDRDDLGHALKELIPNSQFIHGKTPKPLRRQIITQFEKREFDVFIGGKICFRGLDMAGGVENLIIATGGKLSSEYIQKVGRAVRQNKNGLGRVFDFYFLKNYYLYNHSRKRFTTAAAIARNIKLSYKGMIIDGRKFIKSRFRLP